MSLTMAIACAVLFARSAVAQPPISKPARAQVPKVTEPGVANPVPPAEPSMAGGEPAVGVGALGNHCECPLKHCANGDVSWCEVYCSSGQEPVCSCDGFCDSDGNPKASNRCACQ